MSTDTLAEDTDLTIALGRAGWRVVFEERARAWTEAPATMAQLWKQRYRWSYGTMQAMWKHRRAVRREGPRRARSGRRGLAHVAAFHILLPLTAPLVDVFFLYGLVFADPALTLLLGAGMLGVQLLTAMYAFRLERRAARRAVGVPRAADRLPAADVLRAHPVGRERGERRRGALAADEPHRRAEQPAAEAAAAPRPAAVNDHTSALALRQRERAASGAGAPVDLGDTAPVPAVTGRERWLDLLQRGGAGQGDRLGASARPRILSLFPAWGVLFGIGGSMMARSAQHEPEVDVIGHRLRRLLVPLWVFGIVAVPLMLWQGWGAADRRQHVLRRQPRLLDLPVPRPARQHRGRGPDRRPLVHPGLPVVRAAHPADAGGDAAQRARWRCWCRWSSSGSTPG